MPIDDEQLDELLRDVSVPDDLKTSLLQIPDQELNVVHEDSRPRARYRLAIAGLLAAIAATACIFLYLPKTPVANHINDHSASAELLLAQMQRNVDAMAEIQQAAELEFSSEHVVEVEPIANFKESVALAMSLSWKASLDRGASIEFVKPELEYIINTFPGTRGADEARTILRIN